MNQMTINAIGKFLAALSLVAAFTAVEVRADTVVITGGYAEKGKAGFGPYETRLSMRGANFSLDATGRVNEGPCFMGCPSGSIRRFNDAFSNDSAGIGAGTLVYNGVTYSPASGAVSFDLTGVLTVPEVGGAPPALLTISTPFVMRGGFSVGPSGALAEALLAGQGVATFELEYTGPTGGGPPLYRLRGARYEFESVPEPATVLLLGSGLAGACAALRGRRNRARARR